MKAKVLVCLLIMNFSLAVSTDNDPHSNELPRYSDMERSGEIANESQSLSELIEEEYRPRQRTWQTGNCCLNAFLTVFLEYGDYDSNCERIGFGCGRATCYCALGSGATCVACLAILGILS